MQPRITRETEQVLAALLAAIGSWRYGLELGKEADLRSGTLYPLLARLEQAGWVESEWEKIDESAAGRRARRYYRLTGEGELVAREALVKTQQRLSVLRPVLGDA
jgi:DNA-binding PadR family transcriptional regulator